MKTIREAIESLHSGYLPAQYHIEFAFCTREFAGYNCAEIDGAPDLTADKVLKVEQDLASDEEFDARSNRVFVTVNEAEAIEKFENTKSEIERRGGKFGGTLYYCEVSVYDDEEDEFCTGCEVVAPFEHEETK